MLCSYPQWASIFCPQPQAFKKPSFESSFSVAPPQIRKEGSSDCSDFAGSENFGSEDDILHAISDAKSKFITSAKNPFVKHCLKLRNDSSYRYYHGSVLVVGSTPIRFVVMLMQSISKYLLTLVGKSARRPTCYYPFFFPSCFFAS